MKRYQVGDQVWWARYGMREVRVDCPVCYGKLKVNLILGNNDQVTIPCTYCGMGFEGPCGYVTEHQYVADAELVIINEVRIRSISGGSDITEYIVGTPGRGGYYVDPKDLFNTKEEAVARSLLKLQEDAALKETLAEEIKASRHKSYAWNAGYHMREAKRSHESAEYHEKMAVICKSRSKSEPKS